MAETKAREIRTDWKQEWNSYMQDLTTKLHKHNAATGLNRESLKEIDQQVPKAKSRRHRPKKNNANQGKVTSNETNSGNLSRINNGNKENQGENNQQLPKARSRRRRRTKNFVNQDNDTSNEINSNVNKISNIKNLKQGKSNQQVVEARIIRSCRHKRNNVNPISDDGGTSENVPHTSNVNKISTIEQCQEENNKQAPKAKSRKRLLKKTVVNQSNVKTNGGNSINIPHISNGNKISAIEQCQGENNKQVPKVKSRKRLYKNSIVNQSNVKTNGTISTPNAKSRKRLLKKTVVNQSNVKTSGANSVNIPHISNGNKISTIEQCQEETNKQVPHAKSRKRLHKKTVLNESNVKTNGTNDGNIPLSKGNKISNIDQSLKKNNQQVAKARKIRRRRHKSNNVKQNEDDGRTGEYIPHLNNVNLITTIEECKKTLLRTKDKISEAKSRLLYQFVEAQSNINNFHLQKIENHTKYLWNLSMDTSLRHKNVCSTENCLILQDKKSNKNDLKHWNLHKDFLHFPGSQNFNAFVTTQMKKGKPNNIVAIDCEMVEVGGNERRRALARVSIVDYENKTLLDKFVKPEEVVTNFKTEISGIRPEDIINGENFRKVRKEVINLIKDKILVGHGLHHDLKVLNLTHPNKMKRDTSLYKPFKCCATKGRTPSLKDLSKAILGHDIQIGEHSSLEDAVAVMRIYKTVRSSWEGSSILC